METPLRSIVILLAAAIAAIGAIIAANIGLKGPSDQEILRSTQYQSQVEESSGYKVQIELLKAQLASMEANSSSNINTQETIGIEELGQLNDELREKDILIRNLQEEQGMLKQANESIIFLQQEKSTLEDDLRTLEARNSELEVIAEQHIFSEPDKTITSNDLSFQIESANVSDYGQKIFIRLLVSNSGDLPIHLMFDGSEDFIITDLLGNQIELNRTSGIYKCNYGLRGQQYCENYLSKAPLIEAGTTHSVSFQGEVDDRNENPVMGSHYDLNGRFILLDPAKRLSTVSVNFPGIPASQ